MSSITEKIQKLEAEKNRLIAQRKAELVAIIEKAAFLDIDDKVLLGALLFIKNNSNHQIIQEFKAMSFPRKK